MPRPLVILGSARPNGETRRAVDLALGQRSDLVILPHRHIGGYDYSHTNDADGFRGVVKVLLNADNIVFATPVYWYAMSAPLKIFFDRLSDLLETDQISGRALAGKRVWVIATGTEEALPEGFEVPFRRTADYFAMVYRGCAYLYTGTDPGLRAASEAGVTVFGTGI